MRGRVPVLAAVVVTLVGASSLPEETPGPLPEGTVLKATFHTTEGEIAEVGTAFVLAAPSGGPVLVTALHVFGPPAGLDRWIPAERLPDFVTGGETRDAWTGESVADITGAVLTPDARLHDPQSHRPGADYAVFELEDRASIPVGLRPGAVEVGDSLWIATPGLDGAQYYGTIVFDGPENFVSIQLPEGFGLPFGVSGSPMLNTDGEVVGLVSMSGRGSAGERLIHGTRIEDVVEALAGASLNR